MPEPELIQRQREAIRSFRRIDRARSDAETAAHQQHQQATTTADAAFKTARQNAENARKQSLTAAENQRQSTQRSAVSALEDARIRMQEHIDLTALFVNNGRAVMHTGHSMREKESLARLWPVSVPQIGMIASAQARTELERRSSLAKQTSKTLVSAVNEWKSRLTIGSLVLLSGKSILVFLGLGVVGFIVTTIVLLIVGAITEVIVGNNVMIFLVLLISTGFISIRGSELSKITLQKFGWVFGSISSFVMIAYIVWLS